MAGFGERKLKQEKVQRVTRATCGRERVELFWFILSFFKSHGEVSDSDLTHGEREERVVCVIAHGWKHPV